MSESFYKKIIDESPLGYACHKIVCDEEGTPIDYIYEDVNEAFEKFVGLSSKDILNRRVTEVFPSIKEDEADWIKIYGEVALNGGKREFEAYSKPLEQWYSIVAYSPKKGYFVSLLQNISHRVKVEDAMHEIEQRYRSIFEYAPIGITNISMDGCFLDANNAFCKMLGYTRKELSSINFVDITYVEDQKKSQEGIRKMINDRIPVFHIEKRYIRRDGAIIWVYLASTLLRDEEGLPLYFINLVSDITEQKQKEEYKLYMDNLISEMGRVAKIGGWEYDVKSQKGSWTEEIARIHDLDPKHIRNINMNVDYYTPESQQKLLTARKEAIEQGIPYNLELEFISAKGIKKWVRTIGTPTFEHGEVTKLHGSFQDISDRKESEIALQKNEQKYRLIAENAADVISVYNVVQKEFSYISPSVQKLRGISVKTAMKESTDSSVPKEGFEAFSAAIAENLQDFLFNPKTTNHYVNEVQQLCKNGKPVWVEISTKYQYNSDKEIEAVSIIRNIEERKKAEKIMIEFSYRDQLTSLYNRRFYEEELKRLDTKENLPIALIMADVNGLKFTNDKFGHKEGDSLLIGHAKILKEECRSHDIVARIGGDEFVMLLPNAAEFQVRHIIDRIQAKIDKENKKNPVFSLSIGYAVKEGIQESMSEIFKKAEDEMYKQKSSENLRCCKASIAP